MSLETTEEWTFLWRMLIHLKGNKNCHVDPVDPVFFWFIWRCPYTILTLEMCFWFGCIPSISGKNASPFMHVDAKDQNPSDHQRPKSSWFMVKG
jgi:hypothetical protein